MISTPEANQFPVTYSILSSDALMEELPRLYAIQTPVACQLLQSGVNHTYLLTTRDDKWIVRVYRAGWRTLSAVRYELELLSHLAAKGAPVAAPISCKRGELVRSVFAPEGVRYLAMFTYASGTPVSWSEPRDCYMAGRVAAMVHAASADFSSRRPRFRLDLESLIERPLAVLPSFLAHRPDAWRYLQRFAARLRAKIAVEAPGLDWGVCHGDLTGNNIHLADDGTLTIFDFDLCGLGWRAYDLAAVPWKSEWLRVHRKDHDASAVWTAFLEGYTSIRHCDANDLSAVPLFHAVRHLSKLEASAAQAVEVGNLRINDWLLDHQLGFFRHWETEYLTQQWIVAPRNATRGAADEVTGTGPWSAGASEGSGRPQFVGSTLSDGGRTRRNRDRRTSGAPILGPGTASSAFPVTYSILSADALLREVSRTHGIQSPLACRLVQPGANHTYLLTARRQRYVVRVYGRNWRTMSDILHELDLLAHTSAKGLRVAVPLADRDQQLVRCVQAPEGSRQLAVFAYAEGERDSWDEEERCYRAGGTLAAFHSAADDFVSPHARFKLDIEYLIDLPLAKIRPFLAHRPGQLHYLETFIAKLRNRLVDAIQNGLEWGICHGDFTPENVHVTVDNQLTILDFDCCGLGWRGYDFAAIYRLAKYYKKADLWEAFIQGYTARRSLSRADRLAAALFVPIVSLQGWGVRAAKASEWGSLQLGDSHIDRTLTSFISKWETELGVWAL